MATRTALTKSIGERKTARITATIVDDLLGPITLNTLTLTLYDKVSGAILNSRTQQNVLNANGGTVVDGVLTMILDPADNVILDQNETKEIHVAFFEWTYGSGKFGGHEITFPVDNYTKVT